MKQKYTAPNKKYKFLCKCMTCNLFFFSEHKARLHCEKCRKPQNKDE